MQYTGHSAAWAPWVNLTPAGEAFANLRQRNQFATLTNMALASLCWVVVLARGDRRRMLHIGFAVLLGVGNAASASRTGLLQVGLLAGLVVLCCRRHVGVRRVLLAAVLAYGAGAGAAAGADRAVATHRWWRAGAAAAGCPGLHQPAGAAAQCAGVDCPAALAGLGRGELDYAHYMHLYAGGPDDRFCAILDNAHNLPLQPAVELGLPFALLLCGLAAWAVWRGRPGARPILTAPAGLGGAGADWATQPAGIPALVRPVSAGGGPVWLAAVVARPAGWCRPGGRRGWPAGLLAATAWVWMGLLSHQPAVPARPSDRATGHRHCSTR